MTDRTLIKLEDRLKTMCGKSFLYNTKTTKLLAYNFDNEGQYVTLVTDRKPWITRPSSEITKVLDNFMETEDDDQQRSQVAVVQPATTRHFGGLADILMDNIRRCQADKSYLQ